MGEPVQGVMCEKNAASAREGSDVNFTPLGKMETQLPLVTRKFLSSCGKLGSKFSFKRKPMSCLQFNFVNSSPTCPSGEISCRLIRPHGSCSICTDT